MNNYDTLDDVTRLATALQASSPPPAVKDWLAVRALRAAAVSTRDALLAEACTAVADLLEGPKR